MGWGGNLFIIAQEIDILSGGSLKGTDWILNQQGYFQYAGTPATGNLIQSFAPTFGTDAFGNPYAGSNPIFQAITANGQTFKSNQTYFLRCTTGGLNFTNLIMAPGTWNGQQCQIVNVSGAGNLTMDIQTVSNVAGGTSNIVAPQSASGFAWMTPNLLWYPL